MLILILIILIQIGISYNKIIQDKVDNLRRYYKKPILSFGSSCYFMFVTLERLSNLCLNYNSKSELRLLMPLLETNAHSCDSVCVCISHIRIWRIIFRHYSLIYPKLFWLNEVNNLILAIGMVYIWSKIFNL